MREKISERNPQEKAKSVIKHIGSDEIRKLLPVFRDHNISEIGVDTEQGHLVVAVKEIEEGLFQENKKEADELFRE